RQSALSGEITPRFFQDFWPSVPRFRPAGWTGAPAWARPLPRRGPWPARHAAPGARKGPGALRTPGPPGEPLGRSELDGGGERAGGGPAFATHEGDDARGLAPALSWMAPERKGRAPGGWASRRGQGALSTHQVQAGR